MERLARGVESDVGGDRPARGQALRQARRGRVEDAPPLELREQPAEPGRVPCRWSNRSPGRHRKRAGTVVGPARSARSGVHSLHGIFTAVMQTSLRRQRRRRLGDRRRPRGNGANAAKAVAVAIPLFLFLVIALLGVAGRTRVGRRVHVPRRATSRIRSRRSTTSASPSRPPCTTASGDVQLARLGDDRREVVTFADIPPALIDATTSIEDKTFWENSGFDPAGFVAAAIDTIQGRDRGGSTITQQLVRARLLPVERVRGQRLRAQGQGDHPVDPADRGLPGRGGQADDHREVPQPELLRQPQLRRRRRGAELLAQGPQGADAGADGAPGRHPPVPHPVRPREERRRGDLQGQQGRRAGAPRGAADERGRPAPQLHPRPDEDPQRAHRRRLHRRRLRGRQGRARDPRVAGRRPVARAAVRVAGALRARADPVRRRAASARRSTPAATRS